MAVKWTTKKNEIPKMMINAKDLKGRGVEIGKKRKKATYPYCSTMRAATRD